MSTYQEDNSFYGQFHSQDPAGNPVIIITYKGQFDNLQHPETKKLMDYKDHIDYYELKVAENFIASAISQRQGGDTASQVNYNDKYEIINSNGTWAGPFDSYAEAVQQLIIDKENDESGMIGRIIGHCRIVKVMPSFDTYINSNNTTPFFDGNKEKSTIAFKMLQNLEQDHQQLIDSIANLYFTGNNTTFTFDDHDIELKTTVDGGIIDTVSITSDDFSIPVEGKLFHKIRAYLQKTLCDMTDRN